MADRLDSIGNDTISEQPQWKSINFRNFFDDFRNIVSIFKIMNIHSRINNEEYCMNIIYIQLSHEIYYDKYIKNKKLITGYWHFRFTTLLLLIEKNLSDRVE